MQVEGAGRTAATNGSDPQQPSLEAKVRSGNLEQVVEHVRENPQDREAALSLAAQHQPGMVHALAQQTQPQPQQRDPWAQTAGQGAVTMYDTHQRQGYTNRIKEMSADAVRRIDEIGPTGPLDQVETIARDASQSRNTIRTATQKTLTPGGRVLSGILEQDRSWDALMTKYSGGQPPTFDTYRTVAQKAGSSSKDMLKFTKFSKVAGPIGTAFGIGVAGYEIANAPPAERGRVAARETGGILGGAVGATLGTAAGAAAVGLLVSNPAGWAVIGAGVVVGGIAGYFGSEGGRSLGETIHGWFN